MGGHSHIPGTLYTNRQLYLRRLYGGEVPGGHRGGRRGARRCAALQCYQCGLSGSVNRAKWNFLEFSANFWGSSRKNCGFFPHSVNMDKSGIRFFGVFEEIIDYL